MHQHSMSRMVCFFGGFFPPSFSGCMSNMFPAVLGEKLQREEH